MFSDCFQIMAAVYLFVQNHHRRRQVQRVFRDRTNPLDFMTDQQLISHYRLHRESILYLCEILNLDLQRPTIRSCALPVSLQIMTALSYYATGTFQAQNGCIHGMTKMSVSHCIHLVSKALCQRDMTK